ncbi:FF domain-containing protein [Phytophthora infestans]|uniref:FF domain-containing protein n=1 Tax=Phytophthora infestans TaxID=4787 RepID=A0A833W3L8_PHYIN|nr:FF domain-containing protein [Phytophthora infestans]KAF4142313.1 FF domain-containing protein [Phytophthora infestans]
MVDEEPSTKASGTAEQKLYVLNALQVVDEWSVHDDGDGRLFYYDHKTDSSQWEVPDDLASLETEFMMKLMLENNVARSGVWTAHNAGNGTLYYFNSKTRESVWERPHEWGEAEAAAAGAKAAREAREEENQRKDNDKAAKKEKKDKKRQKKHKKQQEKRDIDGGQKDVEAKVEQSAEQVEEETPLTAEELKAEEERKAREQKRIEQFRAMLRDKNIMPLTKWSVALPQIAGDPRFMGVPTMDERRAIYEHFVAHRREDLKAEKKSKLKLAKKQFTELLHEQFQLDSWEPSTTLSVFLSTLERLLDAERYNQIQENVLALLTLSAQEKIYGKAVADYKSEALKRDGEQLRLTKFLEEKISALDKSTMKWESEEVQRLLRDFYSSAASSESAALLSKQQQKQVFEELVARLTRTQDATPDKGDLKEPQRPDPRRRSQSSEHRGSSPRESRHSRHDDRRRSRRRRRSDSRSHSRGRERIHRSRRRSVSSSRSRSRSRRSSRHRRHHSSSSSRSRSRSRR